MNNNPDENLSQQATPNVAPVTPSVTPVADNPPVASSVGQGANTSAVEQPVSNVVQPTSAVVQPVTNNVTAASTVPANPTSTTIVSAQTQPTGPVAPQLDRVQLINDKPKLHAVIGNNGQTFKTSKEEDKTEVLEAEPSETEVLTEEEPKSCFFQNLFLIVLFGGLFAMVIFLPDISNYIETKKYLKTQEEEGEITTGTLKCSLETNSAELDYTHDLTFSFTDRKLTRLTFVSETRGDANLDEEKLNLLKADCEKLAMSAEPLSGITVSCNLAHGTFSKKQVFNYASVVVDDAITAYVEAGGNYPDYEYEENIDTIEREMNASGYSCERFK